MTLSTVYISKKQCKIMNTHNNLCVELSESDRVQDYIVWIDVI